MIVADLGVFVQMQEFTPKEKLLMWHDIAMKNAFGGNTCKNGWMDYKPLTDGGCRDYHAYFGWLDAVGVVSSPYRHSDWYGDCLRFATSNRQGNEKPTVLVMGLATPAMADVALSASGGNSEVTVLDMCPTPLAICEEAMRIPKRNLVVANALDGDLLQRIATERGLFSAVTMDAFFTRFKDSEKKILLKNISKMLRPKFGSLVTTWRIGDGQDGNLPKHYGESDDRKIFLENVEYQAHRSGIKLDFDHLGAAMDYADSMTSHHGQSIEQIKDFMGEYFNDVRIEVSGPVYDVITRKYARIFASDVK